MVARTSTHLLMFLALAFGITTTGCKRGEHCGCSEAAAASLHRAGPPAPGVLIPPRDTPIYPDDASPSAPETSTADHATPDERRAEPCLEPPPEGMACIPGGYFTRGVDLDEHVCNQASQPARGNMGTTPAQRIWMDTYYIDRTEVTNAAYSDCLRAKQCPKDGPRYTDFSAPQQPITGVSWFSANTFCEAQGKHLQREAEFEKAARGPDGELYPWGNTPATCENAVLMDASGRSCGRTKKGNYPQNGRVMEVASRPAGRYDVYDLIGNAEEWVWDYWSTDWASCGDACSQANPQGPCNGEESCEGHRYRVVRGGSWYWPADHATSYHRRAYRPNNEPPHHFGFRCAASQDEAKRLVASSADSR